MDDLDVAADVARPALALVVTALGLARAREMLAARGRVLDAALPTLDPGAAHTLDDRVLVTLAKLPAGITVCRLCDNGRGRERLTIARQSAGFDARACLGSRGR